MSRRHSKPIAVGISLLLWMCVGCQDGVRWHDYDYPRVLADSKADKKIMFVYFRDFASVECTKFEDEILLQPVVLTALRPYYSVPLQWNTLVDAPLAERWQIRQVPSYVILDSSEKVLAKRSHPIKLEQILSDLYRVQGKQPPPPPAPAGDEPREIKTKRDLPR